MGLKCLNLKVIPLILIHIERYGADTLFFVIFAFHQTNLEWSDGAVDGATAFEKVWQYAQ